MDRIKIFREFMGDCVSESTVKWLSDNDFFTSPASTKYHGSYPGGLFDHSYNVAKSLIELTEHNNLKWQRPESPRIVGMFHDLCKIDNYVESEIGFEYSQCSLLTGHGEKSIMLLSTQMQLTMEEVMCIRYHMGAFVDKSEWNNYTRGVKAHPNVLWTHHADMIASQILEG